MTMEPYQPAPPEYLEHLRQDGSVDQRYLKGFAHRLSQLLISKNQVEILHLGQMIHEATVRHRLPDGELSHPYWEQWPDGGPYGEFDDWKLIPDIGDTDPISKQSNILRVMKWAEKREWYHGMLRDAPQSPRYEVGYVLTVAEATNKIISVIAAGIRESK